MNRLEILTSSEVQAIHRATLRVLSETGITLTHPVGRQTLLDAGAQIRGERVLFPPDLVETSLAQCPAQVNIRSRDGQIKKLGDGQLDWHNLGGARDVYEPGTGQKRPAIVQDVRDSARLLDALDQVTSLTPFFTPQDVPGEIMSLAMYRYSIPHTTKPLQGPGVQNAVEVNYAIRMAEVLGPPQETLSLSVSPVSPLFFPDDIAAAMIAIAQNGVPFGPLPCPTAGTTAPFSLAGALTLQNAEVLASIVLAQLVRPGLPIVYCGRLAMMEPRTGFSVWGGVELGLVSAGTVQVGHSYHLPVNVYGFSTNAHVFDIQNGFERALNAAIPALAGADELSGIGEMEAGVMGSYPQMVCDNEIAAGVRRLLRGFAADQDALAVEVIAAVMGGPGNFLTEDHTIRYLRGGEILIQKLAEREPWDTWDQAGRRGMADRAAAEAERILAEHVVPPLTEDQDRALDDLLRAAEQELAAG
jgi:trimethylamine--corrinoid protein Co-methyltransferase